MQTLGEGREVFGLIHADLYERNYSRLVPALGLSMVSEDVGNDLG